MTAVVAMAGGAIFLLLMHRLARRSVPRGTITATEAFVFGHWPFFYLNAAIVAITGGYEWGTVNRIGWKPFLLAGLCGAIGLTAFMTGAAVAEVRYRQWKQRYRILTDNRTSLIVAGVIMAAVGLLSIFINYRLATDVGFEGRRTELLALADLAVPGLLLIFGFANHPRSHAVARMWAWGIFLCAAPLLMFAWSRRPLLLIVSAVILCRPLLRTGRIPRSRVLFVILAVTAASILLVIVRTVSYWGFDTQRILQGRGVLEWYSSVLWIETSSFSAAAWVVDEFGLMNTAGLGSLIQPFIFWIPRAFFPAKPVGFEIGGLLGLPYTIGPSLYGEVIYDASIVGLVPILMFLGYVVKSIDLRFLRTRNPSAAYRLVYFMFVFDVVFVVRGNFVAAVIPMLVHCVLAAAIVWTISSFSPYVDRQRTTGVGVEWKRRRFGRTMPEPKSENS